MPRKHGKRQSKLLGSHQRCWIWGRHLVLETLQAGRWPILELHLAEELPEEQRKTAHQLAARAGIPLQLGTRASLARLCRTEEHQGYVAKMPPFPYREVSEILASPSASPLYLVLDAIQDPYNFGAMLRSAEVFAIDAAFIGSERQVEVTSLVARSSAGAINRLPLARAETLTGLADLLRERGIALVGTSEKTDLAIDRYDFTQPTAIVIGNEGVGITPELAACCDAFVTIPQYGSINSLNAAAAAAIVFYEARRQRSGRA